MGHLPMVESRGDRDGHLLLERVPWTGLGGEDTSGLFGLGVRPAT
ncbi:hypothetical protein [Streptosporangium sp. NPDC049046]